MLGFGMIYSPEAAIAAGERSLYDPHGKRDPFVPLVTLATKVSSSLLGVENIDEITVEGVVYDPKKGSVVIANGSVLKEGEEFGSVKVVSIKPNGAVFSINGVKDFKAMYQEEPKGK